MWITLGYSFEQTWHNAMSAMTVLRWEFKINALAIAPSLAPCCRCMTPAWVAAVGRLSTSPTFISSRWMWQCNRPTRSNRSAKGQYSLWINNEWVPWNSTTSDVTKKSEISKSEWFYVKCKCKQRKSLLSFFFPPTPACILYIPKVALSWKASCNGLWRKNTPHLRGDSWYPLCEFKLQSWTSLPLLCCWRECEPACDCGILIIHASCVQALHCGFMPLLNHYTTSAFLPLNHHWGWEEWDALKYWLYRRLYRRLDSLCSNNWDECIDPVKMSSCI